MTDRIEIEDVRRLDIKQGETLVIKLSKPTDIDEMEQTKNLICEALPDGISVLVISPDVKMYVVAGEP